MTASLELYDWYRQVLNGQIAAARRRVVVVVADETGPDQAPFVVREAWPVKYEPSALNAQGPEVSIETLELANEGIERVS